MRPGACTGPTPCSKKASTRHSIRQWMQSSGAAQIIVTQPHNPGEIRSRPPQEPFFVEHIDPAVIYRFDTRSSRPCEFCRELDPQFPQRRPLDQVVASSRKAIASAHLTEDGYVRHRMLELRRITSRAPLTAA
jgi:hypothetical protein